MMSKKTYTKPLIQMVELRAEERLATCDFYFTDMYISPSACDHWLLSNPSTCIAYTNPQGAS